MRKKRLIISILLVLILITGAFALTNGLKPYISEAAKNCVVNAASDEIVRAVNEELAQSGEDFSSYILLEKDYQGNITAIRTNMALMNGLKMRIMERISENLYSLDEKMLRLPLGSMFIPSFFGIGGPYLQMQIASLSTLDSTIASSVEQTGINQAQQNITIHVQIDLTVITPVGKESVKVSSDVPIAQTLIVGVVPNTMIEHYDQKG